MHTVVNHLHLASALPADTWARAEAELAARSAAIEGFRSLQVVQVADDHLVLVINADTAECLDRMAAEVGGPWMRENVVPHLSSPPQRLLGEVVASFGS